VIPLLVALPFLVAPALAAVGRFLPAAVDDVVAIVTAAAVSVLAFLLVLDSLDGPVHYAFGGWEARDEIALGVVFSADALSAGLAALASLLATASLAFAWRSFDETGALFNVLMLGFLAGMTGFALAADLFTMFVFFELMGVCAFALTAYRIDEPGPLQGAFNFAVVNSVGALLALVGIALVYGRTGALNLAQVGETLAGEPTDGLVIVAFALVAAGFMVKAGIVPFHFWLSDAYAVAPGAVCVLLSGVMSDLGIHGIARVYWHGFSGSLDDGALRAILLGFGIATAALGAVMAWLQADLKRMLAFVTISHAGVFLAGTALLTPEGLAGTVLYVAADGLVKAALFLAVAIVVLRVGHPDELLLRGRGRHLRVTGTVFLLGGLAMAAPPPFGSFLGRALVDDSARELGLGWLPPLLVVLGAVAAAAVVRAGARVFLGLGVERDLRLSRQHEEELEAEPKRAPSGLAPFALSLPAAALLAAGLVLAFLPGIAGEAVADASHFVDRPAYAREVLRGASVEVPPAPDAGPSRVAYAYALGGTALTLVLAAAGLYRNRLPRAPVAALRRLHTGAVGDEVAWTLAGAAVLGGLLALAYA
jgi:multicomponent Na+:H+ antiporter subunit D